MGWLRVEGLGLRGLGFMDLKVRGFRLEGSECSVGALRFKVCYLFRLRAPANHAWVLYGK